MILELADIRIEPGKQAEFDAAIVKGVETVIAKAKGFRGYKVNKGVELPERYILMVFWETLVPMPGHRSAVCRPTRRAVPQYRACGYSQARDAR